MLLVRLHVLGGELGGPQLQAGRGGQQHLDGERSHRPTALPAATAVPGLVTMGGRGGRPVIQARKEAQVLGAAEE